MIDASFIQSPAVGSCCNVELWSIPYIWSQIRRREAGRYSAMRLKAACLRWSDTPLPFIYPLLFLATTMNVSPSLETVPQEVLEHIAFFAATDAFLGPPSALIPLLVTNRKIHSRLSITSNHHLYAHIFVHKFDLVHPLRRLGVGRTTPTVLARELQRRCMALKRIRERLDANICTSSSVRDWGRESLHSLLFHVYLLMLENEGKNELQLREYARIDNWLREYWFHEHGASSALSYIKRDQWPPNNQETSLAMWLFWFLLKPGQRTCLIRHSDLSKDLSR